RGLDHIIAAVTQPGGNDLYVVLIVIHDQDTARLEFRVARAFGHGSPSRRTGAASCGSPCTMVQERCQKRMPVRFGAGFQAPFRRDRARLAERLEKMYCGLNGSRKRRERMRRSTNASRNCHVLRR